MVHLTATFLLCLLPLAILALPKSTDTKNGNEEKILDIHQDKIDSVSSQSEELDTKDKHISKRFAFLGEGFARPRVVAVPVAVPVGRFGFASGFANSFGAPRFGFGGGFAERRFGFEQPRFGFGEHQFGVDRFGERPFGGDRFGERPFGGDRFGERAFGGDRFGERPFGGDRFGAHFDGGFRRPFRSGPGLEETLEAGSNVGVSNGLVPGAGLRQGFDNDNGIAEQIEPRFGNTFSNRHKSDRNTVIVVAPNTNKITNDNALGRARNILKKQKLTSVLEDNDDLADSRDDRL